MHTYIVYDARTGKKLGILTATDPTDAKYIAQGTYFDTYVRDLRVYELD